MGPETATRKAIRVAVVFLSGVRLLEFCDAELLHPYHGLHRSLRTGGFLVLQHVEQGAGDDLLRNAVPLLEPAALLRPLVPAFGKAFPAVVHLLPDFAQNPNPGRCPRRTAPPLPPDRRTTGKG